MGTNFALLAAWGASIYLSHKLYRDVFTPLCIYFSVWSFCLLLFRLRLVDYYELETKTIVLIGGSILSFVLGCIIAHRRKAAHEEIPNSAGRIHQGLLEYSIRLLLVLYFVGAVIFTYRMNAAYGLATYITNPAVIRQDADEWTRMGLLALLLDLNYPLLVCSWVHRLLTKKWQWFSILGVLLPLALTFLQTDRGTLTTYVITCIFLWIYWNHCRSLTWKMVRRLSAIAALLLAYFLAIGLLYGKILSQQTDVINTRDFSATSDVGLALASPYVYATGSFPAFQEAMRDVRQMSWGTHTFFPIARVLSGLGFLREKPEGFTTDFYLVPIPFNVYTHLFSFYQDFGVAGVILLPMGLGYMETRLYLGMKASPNLFLFGATSAFTALNIFSVFIPMMTSLGFWYYFTVLYAISRFCDAQATAFKCEGALGQPRAPLTPWNA